jgi:hypothetical protein
MTFLSIAAAGAFAALSKAADPALNIRPALMVLGGVALGCLIMTAVSGRKKDEN